MTVDELSQCIAAAKGNKGQINKCEKDFTDAGGNSGAQQDGKVFSDTTGGKVFVTADGKVFGKVF